MRKLFMTDIHGCYEEMEKLFNESKFDPSVDQLIIGGDMIDRGPDSAKVLRRLKELQEKYPHNVIAISGNHEDMARMYLAGMNNMWFSHGKEAIDSFDREFDDNEFSEYLGWAISRPIMYEDDEYVYVHAGIIPGVPLDKQDRFQVLWMPYATGSFRFDRDFAAEEVLKTTGGKKVVSGHTPKSYIFDDGARMICDLGAAVKDKDAKLALIDLTNGKYWYYDFDKNEIKVRKIARKK